MFIYQLFLWIMGLVSVLRQYSKSLRQIINSPSVGTLSLPHSSIALLCNALQTCYLVTSTNALQCKSAFTRVVQKWDTLSAGSKMMLLVIYHPATALLSIGTTTGM